MGLKTILTQAAQFAANAGMQNLDLSKTPIGLQVSYPLIDVDDFNEATKSPLWITAPIPPPPPPPLTEEYSTQHTVDGLGISSDSGRFAETFQLPQGMVLSSVSWWVYQFQSPCPGYLEVEVWTTQGSPAIPGGTLLGTSSPVNAYSLPVQPRAEGPFQAPGPFQLTAFNFPQPITLQAGVIYAVVLRQIGTAPSPSNNIVEANLDESPSQFLGGNAWASSDGGSTWSKIGDFYTANPYTVFFFELSGTQVSTASPTPNPYPIVSGGYLEFDYTALNNYSGEPPSIETVYNAPMGSLGMKTRFIWTILNASAEGSGNLWGLQILQGTIPNPPPITDAQDQAELLVAVYIRASPSGDYLSFLPVIVDANGNVQCWIPQGGTTGAWFTGRDPGSQGGWFMSPAGFPTSQSPAGNAAGVPVTIEVVQQPNGGVVILAYTQDNPSQIIFQTDPSPAVRVLPGQMFLDIGHSPDMFGSKFQFDYFYLGGPPAVPPSGYIILRTAAALESKVTGFSLNRTLPDAASKINVRVRSADDLASLQAAAFSDPLPTTVSGNVETGAVAMAAGLFIDVMLEFIAGSPSPLLTEFDFTTEVLAVLQDQPIILSLDAAGPGIAVAASSEEGTSQTPNTAKLIDGDPATQWVSQNATDGQTVTLSIEFVQPNGSPGTANVNALILRNTNVKAIRVYVANVTLFQGEITGTDVIIPFSLLTTSFIYIDVTTTQVPNQQKAIGEVYCGQALVVLPNFDAYDPARKLVQSGTMRALGGRMIAYRGTNKYSSKWKVLLVRQADRDAAEQAFEQNPLVSFWPEPGSNPRNLYNVGWTVQALPLGYTDKFKGAGYAIEAQMEEI
ncbi:MAG: hypothetical protein ACYCPQ_00565 [Elusimicrobiota bacterium]